MAWARMAAVALVAMMLTATMPAPSAEAATNEISIIYPNGGEDIVSGSTQRIRWSISGPGGYVSIELSIGGGRTSERLETIANTPSHGQGWWDWFVPPNMNEAKCVINVTWVTSLLKPFEVLDSDESDNPFDVQPGLHLEFNQVPANVTYGKYYLITYDLLDPLRTVGGLRFTWRVDDGSGLGDWVALPPGGFSYVDPTRGWIWWMPPYYTTATAEIRVEALAKASRIVLGSDITPALNITSPSISLIQPDGGVVLVGGTSYTIKWRTSSDPEHVILGVLLQYSTNGGGSWLIISTCTDNDFEEPWTVPTGIDSPNVLVRVDALYGEWYSFADDRSSSPNRIISDPNTLTVTLLAPNPPMDGGEVLLSNETYRVSWSTTGSNADIKQFRLYYSTDGGLSWDSFAGATAPARWYMWDVPEVDTYTARVKVELEPKTGSRLSAVSNHDFFIFDTIAWNFAPIAMAGPDLSGGEDEVIRLDGTASYDRNGDPLTYSWAQVSPSTPHVALAGATTAKPSFQVELTSYPVAFMFELTVDDGFTHDDPVLYNTDRVMVDVQPRPPAINWVSPDTAWAGTMVTVNGSDLRGADVLIGGVSVGRVLTEPVLPLNPDPEHNYTFFMPATVPHGRHTITLRTMGGEVTSAQEVEVFPEPTWLYENAMGFHNPTTHTLSYPADPLATGRYKDAFGNQVYLCLWICIGIPWWDPWNGWYCLGYLIEEPWCPDPIASIYYGAVFCWIARYGECFGMSSVALEFCHDAIQVSDFGQSGAVRPSDLDNTGRMDARVDWRQGAQMSAEVLNVYLDTLVCGLMPSSPATGLGAWETAVKGSIDSGMLGVATMICDEGAHAVVPYAYEEVDSTHTRFYVYDSNRDEFSKQDTAAEQAATGDDANDSPPYVEVIKEGTYWDWSFMSVDGTEWRDEVGIAFVPWPVIHGDRTMPLSVEGITNLLAGDASVTVEDGKGGVVGYDSSSSLQWGIEGAAPLPQFGAAGSKVQSWHLPTGNYTARVKGTGDGLYNWSMVNNGTSAICIESAEVRGTSEDSIAVSYTDGDPYRGRVRYGTNDIGKEYTLAIVDKFGIRERVFRIKGADLAAGAGHEVGTNGDCTGIVFTNEGSAPTTFDVEFQHNVLSESVWNGSGRPVAPHLPTASRKGITVGPGGTVTIRPTNWLDLDHCMVIIEGETVPDAPKDLVVHPRGAQASLSWAAPASDGGWPIIRYVVLRGDTEGNLTVIGEAAGTSYVDAAVERGRTYWYAVRAANAIGEGERTPVSSVAIPDKGGGGGGGLPWLLVVVAIIALMAVVAAVAIARGRGRGGAPSTEPPPAPAEAGQATGPPPGHVAQEGSTGRPPG